MSDNVIFSIVRRDSVEVLLNHLGRVDPAIKTDDGRSMLHVAIAYRKPQHAEQLILRGANLNVQDKDGQTPLHYAAIHGQLDTARLMVERGADQSICDKFGNTPLWYAVFNARGQYELVRLYVAAGGIASHKNNSGRSSLDFAKQISDEKLQELLKVKSTS